VATLAVADELWGRLHTQEGELDNREGTIAAWEDGLAAFKRALGRAHVDRDVVCAQAKAV
jgi:hypothetical protein